MRLIPDLCTVDPHNLLPTSLLDEFPILKQTINGRPLVYLDNAATVQKPVCVLDAVDHYYRTDNANVHRGVHTLSQRATDSFEAAREQLRMHLNAAHTHEILWTRGTTEGVNLVAHGFRTLLQPGDALVVSTLEHHSNLVPWQMLAQATGAELRFIPLLDDGSLDQDAYLELLDRRVKLVAFNHISNALGTVNPVQSMTAAAHQVGAAVFVDGAQAVPHSTVDVQALDVDFYAFSGHKMYGPTGMGVLYGKTEWLERLPPYMGGGEMIDQVRLEGSTYTGLPFKFEAGTPHIAGAIGLAEASRWMHRVGLERIARHEDELLRYATAKLQSVDGIRFYGTAAHKAAVISFNLDGAHPYDVGMLLDQMGIAVRTGQHCTQPIMDRYGIPGTVRASLAAYTTVEDLDALVDGVQKAARMLL
jgi:cysteine desulfurase/selenocysteine lyase